MNDLSESRQANAEAPEFLKRRIRALEQAEARWKQAEEALNKSEETFRNLIENAPDAVYVHAEASFLFLNSMAVALFGAVSADQLIGSPLMDRFHPSCQEMIRERLHLLYQENMALPIVEQTYIRLDGSPVPVEAHAVPITFNHQKAFLTFARDISARKLVEAELHRNREIAERLAQELAIIAEIGRVIGSTLDTEDVYERFAAVTQKLIRFDSITINLYNHQTDTLCVAYVSGVDIDGRRAGDPLVPEGSLSEAVIRARTGMCVQPGSIDETIGRFPRLAPIFQAGLRSIMCVPLVYRDRAIGVLHFRSKTQNAYTEQDLRLAERVGEQIVGTIANAQLYAGLKKTEQELKESERRYRELSIVDDLTRLYNSRQFYVQLKIELDRSNRYEQPLTLLLLDLDDFKAFNDAYGHVEGDQVLWRLGRVIKRCLRETDFAYRYGGEEFTILLPMTTSADGAGIAERIRTEFKKEQFYPVPDREVHVTVSIGLAQYKLKEEMKTFVRRVDRWMYQGKKNGKDRVCSERKG